VSQKGGGGGQANIVGEGDRLTIPSKSFLPKWARQLGLSSPSNRSVLFGFFVFCVNRSGPNLNPFRAFSCTCRDRLSNGSGRQSGSFPDRRIHILWRQASSGRGVKGPIQSTWRGGWAARLVASLVWICFDPGRQRAALGVALRPSHTSPQQHKAEPSELGITRRSSTQPPGR